MSRCNLDQAGQAGASGAASDTSVDPSLSPVDDTSMPRRRCVGLAPAKPFDLGVPRWVAADDEEEQADGAVEPRRTPRGHHDAPEATVNDLSADDALRGHSPPDQGPGGEPTVPDDAEAEAARLRDAYRRRGPVEQRLAGNRGQAAIVRERDEAIVELLISGDLAEYDLLDVGCGEGRTLAMLNDRGVIGRGVGVDLLAERVDRARRASPTLEFHVADGTRLPFPDASFDVVLAMTVFSSVPSPARVAVAREIARVLRPDGRFVWYDMRRRSPANPDVRPFSEADARRIFPGWNVVTRPVTVAPPLARRLGLVTGFAYPILARVPLLLTHEVGAASRPPGDSVGPPPLSATEAAALPRDDA